VEEPKTHCYVFVRTDLTPEQICVQAAHACFDAGRFYCDKNQHHPNFVLCGVVDESSLLKINQETRQQGIRTRIFLESDLGHEFTALATEPVSVGQRRFFRSHKLLKLKGKQ
jgi:hypothetical protein